jgi:hypothetical protein
MSNAKSSGRNNFGLPKVGPGDSLTPSLVNKLSDAVATNAPTLGVGTNIQNTPNGSFTSISKRNQGGHPWKVSLDGTSLYINAGQFFTNRLNGGGENLVTVMASKLGGSRNAWMHQSYLPGGPGWNDANATDLFFMGGAEIFFEDPDCNVISNKQLYVSTDGLRTKRKRGLYYIEVSAWNGRQMSPPYPSPGGSAQLTAANLAATTFNAYSLRMKGKVVPIFKWAPFEKETIAGIEYPGMYEIKQFVYPIATVSKNWQIYQGVSSDIYHVAAPPRPFEVNLTNVAGAYKVSVYPGLVNGMVAKMGGNYLDEVPVPLLTVSGTGRLLLRVTHESQKFFPRNVDVIFQSGTTIPDDTEQYGYQPIAMLAYANNAYTLTQLSLGNKLVNRFKMGAAGAYWSWSA